MDKKPWWKVITQNKSANDPELKRLLYLASSNYLLVGEEKKEFELLLDKLDERLQ